MKSKSISFAQVLNRKIRSPKLDCNRSNCKLSELMQQFDLNPDEDYTLYLGQIGMSHRSKPSPFQMAFSRNHTQNQEQIFDSWIQKQSTLGPNKENIRNQSKVTQNQPIKRFDTKSNKIIGSQSKVRENSNNFNSYTSKGQRSIKPIEESQTQSNFNQLNIQMIKSNHYENDQFNKVRSPKAQVKMPQNIQVKNPFLQAENTKKPKVQAVFKQQRPKQPQSNEKEKERKFSEDSESIQYRAEEQISDIVSKYKDESENEQNEEQMLLAQSTDKPEDICITENNRKNEEADQLLKKRLEDAKNILGNYFEKIKRGKQVETETKIQKQVNNRDDKSSHLVGYSFSTSYLPDQPQTQNHNERHLDEIVSQAADESEENDSNFRRKYLNLTSFEAPPNTQTNNIESVKFSSQSGSQDRLYGIPYGSLQAKLIKSNDRHPNRDFQCREQQPKTIFSPKQQEQSMKNMGSLSNQILPSPKVGKGKQKISLISSKSKSNKRSPTTLKQKQHQSPPTTDFNISEKPNNIKNSRQTSFKLDSVKQQILQTKLQPSRQQLILPTYATATSYTTSKLLPTDYYTTSNYSKPNTTTYYATSTQPQSRSSFTSNYLIGSRTQYAPLKIETPYTLDYSKKQEKKQPTYAMPTQNHTYNSYVTDKETKGNYFSKLDIKESITMQEDKNKHEPTYKNSIGSNNYLSAYNNGIRQHKTGFIQTKQSQNNFLQQSLKKSINLSQSGEFTFDL